jgi:protein arginine N-methyltransferase 1
MAKALEEHYGYLADRVKLEKYQAAIERLVQPQHVEEAAVIDVARQTVEQAGLVEKAEFFQANSFELTLPERVDLIICDHVGYFGFDYNILSLLADARQRFLKPDGIVVPAQIELQCAPVESEICRDLVGRWRDSSVPDDFAWLATPSANTKHALQLTEKDLLATVANLATLELGDEAPAYLSWSAEFDCMRDGMLDGIAGWFDCPLLDDIHMTNSPALSDAIDRPQAFLPLDAPVAVRAGERIRAAIMARHLDNVLGWTIELPDTDKRFAHTTFNGELLDENALTRARPDRVARLNVRGRARQIVLSYCDGERSIADVQEAVSREHPDLFPTAQALSTFITQVLARDTDE